MAESPRSHDLATVAAVAVVAYAIANVGHEGLGHGGACLLVGGDPQFLSAVHFEGERDGMWANRVISAGGTLVNFVLAALGALLLRSRPASPAVHLFAWLTVTVNLLQGTGYWLFSGLGGIGDWAAIARSTDSPGLVRVVLAIAGGLGYWLTIQVALRTLRPFAGGDDQRFPRAHALCLTAYFAGGALYLAAGAFNPHGFKLMLISAAAASFGGTSAFAWMCNFLRGPEHAQDGLEVTYVPRSVPWLAAAAVVAALFVGVLGPGIRL